MSAAPTTRPAVPAPGWAMSTSPRSMLARLRRRPSEAGPVARTATDCRRDRAEVLALYGWGVRGAVLVGVLALVFTMVNVQIFGSAGHTPGASMHSSFLWTIAWLLDPMASLGLGVAILFESVLARHGRREDWLTVVKWFAGLMTWAMNIWPAIETPHPAGLGAGIVLHSLAPGLVLGLAEAAPRVRRKITEILDQLEREAQSIEAREARESAERQATQDRDEQSPVELSGGQPVPIPPAVEPVFRAVPSWAAVAGPARPDPEPEARSGRPAQQPAGRPDRQHTHQHAGQHAGRPEHQHAGRHDTTPAGRPGMQPAGRPDTPGQPAPESRSPSSGSGRKRTGKPLSDERLAEVIRQMTDRNGGRPPSQYQLRQAHGIGGPRAARLLADLDPTPAADPAGNGAATRKDGTP